MLQFDEPLLDAVEDYSKRSICRQEAVRWRILNRTVRDIKSRNANADSDELQAIIDRAVREVRVERRTKGKAGKT